VEEISREFLQSVDLPGLPLAKLQLKVGMPIILLWDLQATEGLCNGTRMQIVELRRYTIHARILTGDFRGSVHLVPRISCTQSLAICITCCHGSSSGPSMLCNHHKLVSGQSLQQIGMDMRVPAFSHCQLYVAMSRVTDVQRLCMLLPSCVRTTTNVAYPEILQDIVSLDGVPAWDNGEDTDEAA
jgi:ATP-dependent DNA helicase PIF1